MAFEVFDAYGAASRPEATLRRSGYLFLAKGVMKRAGSEGATHAQLMFDEEAGRIGVRLLNDDSAQGAREVCVEKSGVAVNVVPLLRYYGLPDPKRIGKRVLPVRFKDGVIVVDARQLRYEGHAEALRRTGIAKRHPGGPER